MNEGLEWVMRPVVRGMCLFESLLDCTLTIDDIADMNEALDVIDENEYRRQKAENDKNGR